MAVALLGRGLAIRAGLSAAANQLENEGTTLSEEGRNVLLRAPTGTGKTWAVVAPYVFSFLSGTAIADRLLYALPLRSLASSLFQSTCEAIAACELTKEVPVRLQTGETSALAGIGDPKLNCGRITFCTIDQILSSYLCTPFSLPLAQANVNAGALVGSLIVLDEYHLLDPDRSLKTSLLLNRHLGALARFVWMTATQSTAASSRMLAADRVDALKIGVPASEIKDMPSQRNKKRRWKWLARPLSGENVWDTHHKMSADRRRTIVVLNTVSRAQRLYRDIRARAPETTRVILLHSRFLAPDRQSHETDARAAFGRNSTEDAILIATQVVEAGLDLSAITLHTELAPANALVQRAGRCARFEGEEGDVLVYDSLDERGTRTFQPYARGQSENGERSEASTDTEITSVKASIDRTASELAKLSGRCLSFEDELSFVDAAHTSLDLAAVDSFDAIEWRRRAALVMTPTSDGRNYPSAAELIRDIDSVSLILADENRLDTPSARLAPRYAPLTISVPRASLAALNELASKSLDPGIWCLKAPVYDQSERGDQFVRYDTIATVGQKYRDWLIASYAGGPLALNPALARYTNSTGLELGEPSHIGDWQTPGGAPDANLNNRPRPDWRYRAETFEAHVAWVRLHARLLCGDAQARSRLAYHWKSIGEAGEDYEDTDHSVALRLLDAAYGLDAGTARSLAITAAALHDVGKLTIAWQSAIWQWQEIKGSDRSHYPIGPNGELKYRSAQAFLDARRKGREVFLAHSDFDHDWVWSDGKREQEVERNYPRPSHALESAWLALPLLATLVDQAGAPVESLAKAALSAIARHHSPTTGTGIVNRNRHLPDLSFDADARNAIRRVFKGAIDTEFESPTHDDWEAFLKTNVQLDLRPGAWGSGFDDWHIWPLAMLCVRIVRLADQRGTKMGATIA